MFGHIDIFILSRFLGLEVLRKTLVIYQYQSFIKELTCWKFWFILHYQKISKSQASLNCRFYPFKEYEKKLDIHAKIEIRGIE